MGVGTARRAELTAILIAFSVLGLVVGGMAIAASRNGTDAVEASGGAGSGDESTQFAGDDASDDEATAHAHAQDGVAHDEAHAEGGGHADGTTEHGHDANTETASHGHSPATTSPPTTAASPCTQGSFLVAAEGEHGGHTQDATTTTSTTTTTVACTGGSATPAANAPAATTPPVTTTPTTHGDHSHDPGPTVPGATTPTTHGDHGHDPGPTVPGPTTPTTHAHDPCDVSWDHGDGHGGHGDGPKVQIDLVRQCYPTVGAQIDAVTNSLYPKYKKASDAATDGWSAATVFFHGIAAHWLKGGAIAATGLDGTFDPASPEVLLYGDGPNPDLVGINYIVNTGKGNGPPAGFEGDWDVWHEHGWLCARISPWPPLVVSESTTQQGCSDQGLVGFDFRGNWLLHLWSIPGWESPEGIFSHENSKV